MSGDTLAIVLAVAGVIVGGVISWWFTRASERDASNKQQKLISTLQGMFADVADSVKALQLAHVPGQVTKLLEASPRPATSTQAIDVVVRASLGALLDEHGEVSVPRLLRAVAQRLPDASPSLVSSSLQELRNAGKLSWPGDDVMKADVIKIYPQGHEANVRVAQAAPIVADDLVNE